jgi:hypothetical protein
MSDPKFNNGAELARLLLGGGTLSPEDLEFIVRIRIPEDLYLDYKHGKILDAPNAGQKLCRFASGFANAEGGVLIVGMVEKERRASDITGCDPSKVGGDLYQWAHHALQPIVPYLGSALIVHVVAHEKGPVLLIAVDRAPRLVSCVKDGKVVHYLRIGDGTCLMDPYLYADLVLGRRQEPELNVSKLGVSCSSGGQILEINLGLALENEGLVWIPDWRAGMVGHTLTRRSALPESLRRKIDLQSSPKENEPDVGFLRCIGSSYGPLAPMEAKELQFEPVRLPPPPMNSARQVLYSWSGGVYVVPSNGRPLWAQLRVKFAAGFARDFNNPSRKTFKADFQERSCRVLREIERPIISWSRQEATP